MRLRCLALLLVCASAFPAVAGVPLSETWYRVQQDLEAGRPDQAQERVADLQQLGSRVGATRMSTWARALVLWAEAHPASSRENLLRMALSLDPKCSEARFSLAKSTWEAGRYWSAFSNFARGWIDMLMDPLRGEELRSSVGGWALISLILSGVLGLLVQTARFLPELAHDALELGRVLFSRANAMIFACVAVALPVFAGLGPVWLLAYLFALVWIYLPRREKVLFGVLWLVVAMAIPALDAWQALALREPPVIERAARLLEEGVVDPVAAEELLTLEEDLRGVAAYHMLAGEMLHLIGDSIPASQEFKRAALAEPRDPLPHLWLGNLALEDGDARVAIQQYRRAVQKSPSLGIAYFNLSVALDQDHLFSEADEARSRAVALGVRSVEHTERDVDGLHLAYPVDVRNLVERLHRTIPQGRERLVRSTGPRIEPKRSLSSPWTLAFLSTGLLGLILWWARRRWMWVAQACSRCGKVFCPQCKSSNESATYCTQCISVFLTRGAVSIDQQAAKVEQIRRRERWQMILRRGASATLMGSGDLLKGRPFRAVVMLFIAVFCLTGVLGWVPLLAVPVMCPAGSGVLRSVLIVVLAVVWIGSVRKGWEAV